MQHLHAQSSTRFTEDVLNQYLTADDAVRTTHEFQRRIENAIDQLLTATDIGNAIDVIEYGLASGSVEQQLRACRLAKLISIRVGASDEEALGTLKRDLQPLSTDNDERLRAEATEALAALSTLQADSAVVDTITKGLNDSSVIVRAAASRASGYLGHFLGQHRNQKIISALLSRSQTEADEQLRTALIRELYSISTSVETADRLVQAVDKDESEAVRQDAARGLVLIGELDPIRKREIAVSFNGKILSDGVRDILKPILQEVHK